MYYASHIYCTGTVPLSGGRYKAEIAENGMNNPFSSN